MFDRILNEVILPNEGGYVNNPNDRGGATNFGITQKTYDKYWENKARIKNLDASAPSVRVITPAEVQEIYFSFWTKSRCDLLWDYAPALTTTHFDMLINTGYERRGIDAAELLQRCISISGVPTTVDGYIGPKTLGNIIIHIRKFPLYGDKNLWITYTNLRKKYYNDIVTHNPSQIEFLKGWLNRVEKTNTWICSNIFGNKI